MRKVKHIVLLKFKKGTSEEHVGQLLGSLSELRREISGIEEFVGGPYSSPEGLNQGYTHGFVMTFSDAAARDRYLPHPAHERVKATIVPHVDAIVAFDFEV